MSDWDESMAFEPDPSMYVYGEDEQQAIGELLQRFTAQDPNLGPGCELRGFFICTSWLKENGDPVLTKLRSRGMSPWEQRGILEYLMEAYDG